MRIQRPNDPPWDASNLGDSSDATRLSEQTTINHEAALDNQQEDLRFRDIIDLAFVRKISETKLAPLRAITFVLSAFRLRDPKCRLFSVDRSEEWEMPHDVPELPDDLRRSMQYQVLRWGKNKQKHVFSFYLESNFLIKQHKRDNPKLFAQLQQENLYIAPRTLGSAATSVLGWFAKVHPGVINFLDFERQVVQALKGVEMGPTETEEWLSGLKDSERLAFEGEGTPVPPVRIFRSKKRHKQRETDVKDITLETIQIRTASKHRNWVLRLLIKAANSNRLPLSSKFVPHGIQTGDISLPGIINGHLTFIESLKVIPIVGLSAEAATVTDKDGKTYREFLKTKTKAETIQPTARTKDLGKWLVVVKRANF